MYTWAINCILFGYCFHVVNSVLASQPVRCRQSGFFLGTPRKVSCGSLSPLSDLGWAVRWGLLNTCSTRWTPGRPAERRRCRMCASAGSPRRRRKTEIRSHSPTAPRDDAGAVTARWASPCSCDAPPTSCCTGTTPRRQSFCRPTRVLVLTCTRCPLQTCNEKKAMRFHKYSTFLEL